MVLTTYNIITLLVFIVGATCDLRLYFCTRHPAVFVRPINQSVINRQTQTHLFIPKFDYTFLSTQTIIRPPPQNFQNKAEYSAIIFTIWEPVSDSCYYNVKLHEAIWIVKLGIVLAGGCEVQVFRMYMDNIKMSSMRNILLKILLKTGSNLYIQYKN